MGNLILEAYKELMEENGMINMEVNLDVKIGRESGLDSLGIVNFIVILEEKLDMNLDKVLVDIRKCTSLREIAKVLQEVKK